MKRWKVWGGFLLISMIVASPMAYAKQIQQNKIKVTHSEIGEITNVYKGLDNSLFKPAVVIPESSTLVSSEVDNNKKFHNLKGFQGRYYASEINDNDNVRVVENSLNISQQGQWQALGLIRNETTSDVGGASIDVILFDSNNNQLEEISVETPVKHIRSGEPAPFQIDSRVDVSKVVKYSLVVTPHPLKEKYSREFVFQKYHEYLFGKKDGRPESAEYPYVINTGFVNKGSEIKKADLTLAWLDYSGKVIYIGSSQADKSVNNIPQDGSCDFEPISVMDQKVASQLIQNDYVAWVVGK